MDQRSFDRLARLLGEASDRRAGLKAALGIVLGGSVAAAAHQADADAKQGKGGKQVGADADKRKKRKKTCKPVCGSGFDCVKVGKRRACVCATGVECGDACCRDGQSCEGGACVAEPEPVECIPAAQPCKGTGRRCCDGRVCASGQGGDQDVACYVPKTGACTVTADCVYGMGCVDGKCAPPAPAGLGQPCSAAAQQLCITPGAVCANYTSASAPGGAHCSLPVGMTCTGDPDCTCYKCFYPNGSVAGGSRGGRAGADTKACCYTSGQQCQNDGQCCVGLSCVNGACSGAICTPPGGDCTTTPCCDGACTNNVCPGGRLTCTIKRSDFPSDGAAGAALKALIEAATGVTTITMGPGTYAPVPDAGEAAALIVGRDLTLQACDPTDKPILDGGATVTGAADVNAKDLTWSGGGRIMHVPTGRTVVVDGVHFRNANAATSTTTESSDKFSGGAIRSFGDLTLKNLDVTRCRADEDNNGDGGGVAAIDGLNLTIRDVNFRQCKGYYAGAVRASQTPLTYTGSPSAKAVVSHNNAVYDAGISYNSEFADVSRKGQTTATLEHLEVRDNEAEATGGIKVSDTEGYVLASITNVDVLNNVASSDYGGMENTFGKEDTADADYPGKAILTNVKINGNSANSSNGWAGGLLNYGKLQLGAGVEITGNKCNWGSGVYNRVKTANVTCTALVVSGNMAANGTAATNNQNYADCYGDGNSQNYRMPQGCCATNKPTWP